MASGTRPVRQVGRDIGITQRDVVGGARRAEQRGGALAVRTVASAKKTMVEAAVLNGQEGCDPEPYATAIPFGRELGLAVISVSEAGCRPRLPW